MWSHAQADQLSDQLFRLQKWSCRFHSTPKYATLYISVGTQANKEVERHESRLAFWSIDSLPAAVGLQSLEIILMQWSS